MRIEKIIDHTHDVRELILKTNEPANFRFKAGQFVSLHVPPIEPNGKPVLRAYSIASSDKTENGFHLIFKHVPKGIASTFVWSLNGSETLTFTGPFGRVLFAEPPTEQIIFLCTGTGLAQHLSYLYSVKEKYPHLKYRMLFGVRRPEDVFYKAQLDTLCKELTNFNYQIVFSANDVPESLLYKKGYLQNHIEAFDFINIPSTFYLCGNGDMIKATKTLLLEKYNFEKSKIHSEAFD